MGVLAGLLQRVEHVLEALGRQDGGIGLVDGLDGFGLPVLDFENQQAAARMQDDEVGMAVGRADGDVVPAQVVVFKFGFEALGEAAFACLHARGAGAVAGD